MRENQGDECHGAHFPNSELIIPLDPSLTPDPLLLCVGGKEPQMTVTHTFIQHTKPVMTYTNDARTASSNVECHHSLRDKWGFWVFNRLVCRRYWVYSTNLVCLASERVLVLVWLESLFIGSYIYHLDVIAGTHAMLLI